MKPARFLIAFVSCLLLCAAASSEEIVNSIGMKLVRIEPGSFVMGQDGPPADYKTVQHADKCDQADWDERPTHRVKLTAAFHMAVTEVTNAQYRRFKLGANADGQDDEAATGVSWHDAMNFCEWLSAKEGTPYRLPTEAEWEYACRAGTTTLFHTGDRLPDGFQKWRFNDKLIKRFFSKTGKFPRDYRDWPAEAPLRVAQTTANAWGLYDMHGNVEEWCFDWYGPYEAGEQTDPVGRADGDFRVTRGGSHSDFTRMLRSANRSGRLAECANEKIGFRVVLGERPKTPPLPVPPPPLNARKVAASLRDAINNEDSRHGVTRLQPFFSGPKPFVKVPPNLAGPMFSNHNHSPAIAECPNGDLLAVWFSCGDEGGAELAVIGSRLRRGASEWELASPFWDGPDINDHAPKLWFDGERTLFFFAKGFSENVVRTSTDSGATWSKGRMLQPNCEIGNMLLRTREGFLVLPLDGNKPGASLNISRDGGQTWSFATAHGKPDFRPSGKGPRFAGIHNAIAQLADGRIMALGRFDQPQEQEKFNFRIPLSYSSDWGRTWTYEASEFPAIGSVQRAVLLRLREGPLLFCSFTDEQRYWSRRKGMSFKTADGTEFTGYGLFAAVSFDEGKTWPLRRLVTPGGPERTVAGVDKRVFTLSDTMAEPSGYLAACQTRDGMIQLISSKNHYVFNLAWLKTRPAAHAPNANATADAHLVVGSPVDAAAKAVPTVQPATKQNIIVFKEPGRYGGWPANHGLWQWGNELVAGFQRNWYKHATNDHAIDRSKPHEICQARSLDGGLTWKLEDKLPFSDSKTERKPEALAEPLDFTAPDFALMFRFGSLHVGPSWFYVSNDRCRTWRGPFSFAVEGIEKICTRTDLVVLSKRDCLMFGSAAKSDDKEGRVFCARTTDGGLHWKLVSLIGPEPATGDFAIMPSTAQLPSGAIITTIRHGKGSFKISAWRSDDLGRHWTLLGDATPNIGSNPPALVILKNGQLCLTYGYRRKPYGVRARISSDEGRTWGPEIILHDDGLTGDLGYPRSVVRPDGKVLTVYYFNGPRDEDRAIEGTLWRP
ncbi:MAG: SUMF1/EgtB/PvdO family nonheme iron enzyme [Verrucomicrobia bacterium]|nr:SUMF1/EgtB/PvdO family nonheme iron enzyme [Verrucomicrobiota bacterium]